MAAVLKTPDSLPGGVWQGLLQHAFVLVEEIAAHGLKDPFWTFGGGTVLMLRYRHRMSKDIDIFVPDPQSIFELAMGATALPCVEEIAPDSFMPSSRSVAFRRSAWDAVGGYPAWMSFSEDLLFDLALKNRGFRFAFAPRAIVKFRPRSNLAAFWRQYPHRIAPIF